MKTSLCRVFGDLLNETRPVFPPPGRHMVALINSRSRFRPSHNPDSTIVINQSEFLSRDDDRDGDAVPLRKPGGGRLSTRRDGQFFPAVQGMPSSAA
jgi:hypothetical protein